MNEELAQKILLKAISTNTAANLLERLFDGDAVTIDGITGELVYISEDQLNSMTVTTIEDQQPNV